MATKPSPLPRLRVSREKPVTGVSRAPRHAPLVAATISPKVQSGSATARLLLQSGRDRVMIRERYHGRADGLARLVALAGHQQNIASAQSCDRVADGRSPVGDLDGAGRTGQDFAANGGGALAARIVVGDDGDVRLGGRQGPPLGPLAPVAGV